MFASEILLTSKFRRSLFRPEDVPTLMTELRDIEQRLDAFARRVQASNAARPGGNGFYSSSLSTIGVPDGWFRRVKYLLEEEACGGHPPKAEVTTIEVHP